MKNYGINNEVDYLNFFNASIESGVKNFCFKGDNGTTKVFKNIINAQHVKRVTKRVSGICNKGDILLIDNHGHKYPLSIKMNGVKTAWESADSSLKHILYNFLHCYGRIDIPNLLSIRVDLHDENLEKYVFGDDIIQDNGSIIIQTFNYAKYVKYNDNTIIFNSHRLYNAFDEIENDEQYAPVIAVRKDSLRNKHDSFVNGYRIQVIPQHVSTSIVDIIDLI